jgi:hypothetical protein
VSAELLTLDPGTNVPAKEAQFVATKDGLTLTGGTDTVIGGAQYGVDGRAFLSLDITADDPGTVRPLTIAGLLAGLLTGWLLTSAVAYRIRRSGQPHRRVAAALGVLALAAAAAPAFVAGCETYQVMMYDACTQPVHRIQPCRSDPDGAAGGRCRCRGDCLGRRSDGRGAPPAGAGLQAGQRMNADIEASARLFRPPTSDGGGAYHRRQRLGDHRVAGAGRVKPVPREEGGVGGERRGCRCVRGGDTATRGAGRRRLRPL